MLTRYPILTRPKNNFDVFDEFDKIAGDMFKKSSNYPPYNVYTETSTETPVIEMSVIGFSKDEIEIEYLNDEGELHIKGTKKYQEDETYAPEKTYSYRGLSMKNFTRVFNVNQNLKVDDIVMKDGLLTISFKRDEKKTIKYDIK